MPAGSAHRIARVLTWSLCCIVFCLAPLRADITADFSSITSGAQGQSIAAPGTPGGVAMFGTAAFPVLLGTASPVQAVIAAGRYGDSYDAGAARMVACSHTGFFSTTGASGTLFGNAVLWASRRSTATGTTVAIANSVVASSFFTGKGYSTVAVGNNLTAANLSTAQVLVINLHSSFTAAALTNIRNFAASGGGIVICATPWALSSQQFADANLTLSPFGLVFSGSTPDDATFTVASAAHPVINTALTAADALIADREGTSVMTAANRTIAANAIFQVVNVRMDIPALAAKLEVLGDNSHYGMIAPTAAAPINTSQRPVEKMLARYQSQTFDQLTPAQLFVHPSAADFPGLPVVGTPTLNRTISVNGNTPTDFYMNQGGKPTRTETGLYAPPGGTITVTIPADKIAQGLQVHLSGNGSEDTTFNYGTWTYFPKLWRRVALTQASTRTGHVFGGLITILVPAGKSLGTFDVTISGAMAAPAFTLGEVTDAQWNGGLKSTGAPYGFLRNSKLTLYLPAAQLAALSNPTAVASYWKQVMDIGDEYYGYEPYRKRGEAVATARYVSAGAAYAGYPIEAGWGASSESLLNTAMTQGDWGTYHELGHGYQDNFDSAFVVALSAEVDVNLLPGMVYTLLHDRTAWDGAHSSYDAAGRLSARNTFLALTAAERTWQNAHDSYPVAYDFYFNLAEAFGWQVYKTMLGRLMRYLQSPSSATDAALHALSTSDTNFKRNRFYLLMCDAAGRNLDAYFQRYGLGVTGGGYEITQSVKNLVAAKNYPVWTENTAIDSLSTPPVLSVPEDTPPGAEVYAFQAVDAEEPGTIWDYQITAGNTGDAFTMDRRTGKLRVQKVDAETLGTYSLTVQVQDNGVPRYSTSRTFTVNVQNVAEPPQVQGRLLTASSAQAQGAVLGNISVTLEQGRTLAGWEIVSGNDGHFVLNGATGVVTLNQPATLPNPGFVVLNMRATDSAGAIGYGTVTILCNRTTGILEERWAGSTMTGNSGVTSTWSSFASSQNVAENYMRRVSGWLIPPTTGVYTFWIASDDSSTLSLSADESHAGLTAVASVASYTSFQAWDATASQRSAPRFMVAGRAYAVEAVHREGGGADHLAVAWQGPGISRQVVPGTALVPRNATTSFPPAANSNPGVVISSPAEGAILFTPGSVALAASMGEHTLTISRVQFLDGESVIGEAEVPPYSAVWLNPAAGTRQLRARVIHTTGTIDSAVRTVLVAPAGPPVVQITSPRQPTARLAVPGGIWLRAVIADDGPGTPATSWSRVSGPGTVTFGDATSPHTTAWFPVAGIYLVRLTAYDGVHSAASDVTVAVGGSSGGQNLAPQVSAGADTSLTIMQAALSGSVTDDGLPNPPAAVTVAWSRASGPGPVSFSQASSAATGVALETPGTYVLRLSADDGEVESFDELTLTTPSAVDLWRSVRFGSQAANVTVSGSIADPNHNGVPNLLEYAFGTDPLAVGSGSVVRSSLANGHLTLSFTRQPSASGVTLTVQAADDLGGTWEDLAQSDAGAAFASLLHGVVVTESPTGDGRVQVTVSDRVLMNDPTHPRRFMRLRAIEN